METVAYVEINYERSTDLAWLIELPDVGWIWLPKSQVDVDEQDMEVEVPDWIIVEKGIG